MFIGKGDWWGTQKERKLAAVSTKVANEVDYKMKKKKKTGEKDENERIEKRDIFIFLLFPLSADNFDWSHTTHRRYMHQKCQRRVKLKNMLREIHNNISLT